MRSGMALYSGAASVVLSLSAFVFANYLANVPEDREPVHRLIYRGASGDAALYGITMKGTTSVTGDRPSSSVIDTEIYLRQLVTSASPDLISLRTTVDSGTISVNGHLWPSPVIGQQTDCSIRQDGEVLSSSGYSGLNMKSLYIVWPNRDLRTGDSWTETHPASKEIPVVLTVTYLVASFARLRNEDIAIIRTQMASVRGSSLPETNLEVSARGRILFSITRGRILLNDVSSRSELESSYAHARQQRTSMMEMEMTMQLALMREAP